MRSMRPFLLATVFFLMGCSVSDGRAAAAQESTVETQEFDVELRRVWSGSVANFYASEPSPDGRILSEIDWSGGDLAIRHLPSGELRRVTHKKTWTDSVDYAEHSVFSPDGQRIAYAWFSESANGYEIREIGVDGSDMRTILEAHPDLGYIAPEDWSSDGEEILVTVFRSDRSSAVATLSAKDGALRTLKTSDWRHPFVARFSPDTRYLAYDFQPDEGSLQRDIFAMPADGSRETLLVGGPSHDVLLGWLPTGGAILFYSDRHHTRGVWMQRVEEGQPFGEPELVKPDVWQLFPLGFSKDAFYYGVTVESSQVHTATVDLENARVVVQPAAVQEPSEGGTRFGTWSPDGRYLAYLKSQLGERRTSLVIRSAEAGETREVPLDLNQARRLQWHPDGKSVVMEGTDQKGRDGLHRVNIQTGEHGVFFEGEVNGSYRLAPDGRTLYVSRALSTEEGETGLRRTSEIVAIDVETGDTRVLHTLRPRRIFLSPDGEHYATRDHDVDAGTRSIVVGRTDGTGELRTIFVSRIPIPAGAGGFPFTPDGRHVLVPQVFACDGTPFLCEHERREGARILMVPVDGGEPRVLMDLPKGRIQDLELSPDGRRIAFNTGEFRGEIWRIENLPVVEDYAATEGSR